MILNFAIDVDEKRHMIMEELLQRLERQIKELIDQHDQLKVSNQQLNQGKFSLVLDKETLLAKQKKAISQIEMLISKLKSIEKIP